MADDPIAVPGFEVHTIFDNTVGKLQDTIDAHNTDMVVDVEMVFKSIFIKKGPTIAELFFSQKHKQECMEIRLTTKNSQRYSTLGGNSTVC